MSTVIVHRLEASQRERYTEHLLALPAADLQLRFGSSLVPEAIRKYVESIDTERDAVFAVFGDDLEVHGAAHLAFGDDAAELGVSVLPSQRGRGIGSALFQRAEAHARNRYTRRLFMHCLAQNAAVMRIAKRAGMHIVVESGDADAWLQLSSPTAASVTDEFLRERVALFDFGLKSQLAAFRSAGDAALEAVRGLGQAADEIGRDAVERGPSSAAAASASANDAPVPASGGNSAQGGG